MVNIHAFKRILVFIVTTSSYHIEKIYFAAVKVFKVDGDSDFKVTLEENNNISLSKTNFNKIIQNYSQCACFHVTLQLDAKITPGLVVAPDVSG